LSTERAHGEKPLTRGQRLLAGAAFLHLVSVAVFIWSGFPGDRTGTAPGVLRAYRNASGTFRDYAFFAPSVASDVKAGFVVSDRGGHATFIHFAAANREIDFRFNCVIAACMRDPRGRDLFARSWAAMLLGGTPGADRVGVVVKALDVPTMRRYREGSRTQWSTVYVGEFERRAPGAAR
jgi:hypothetical protein